MPSPLKETDSPQQTLPASLDIGQLNEQAVRGLAPMFNSERQLFCHRLLQSDSRLVQEGLSRRYTLMTLLGLKKSESAGYLSPVKIGAVFDRLLQDVTWIDNLGDLGLLLWTCATVAPERLSEVSAKVNLQSEFEQSRVVREGRTMELAWFLSGLAHASLASPREFHDQADLAQRVYAILRRNQGDTGAFGHLYAKGTVNGLLRGRIGSFADQVYPIYALSKFVQAYQVNAALGLAKKCADLICRGQGAMGQWWWHYDTATGGVFEQYPVYSVHQEGMAPMALFALEEAGHFDYAEPIYKGLSWIAGSNELSSDMRDPSGLVWRCLYHRRKYKAYLDRAQGVLGSGVSREASRDLDILRECRPYELGWLLYAFAGRETATV